MSAARMIVGLGNPGGDYSGTRHNVGFDLVEAVAHRWSGAWSRDRKFFAKTAAVEIGGTRVLLVQPQTYMNESGRCVGPLARWSRIEPAAILAVSDDADLPMGSLRLRPGGSSGGHRGLLSLEEHLGTRDFPRLRVGIGRPEQSRRDIAGYVLGKWSATERDSVAAMLDRACDQVATWVAAGVAQAMNQFNGPPPGLAPTKGKQ